MPTIKPRALRISVKQQQQKANAQSVIMRCDLKCQNIQNYTCCDAHHITTMNNDIYIYIHIYIYMHIIVIIIIIIILYKHYNLHRIWDFSIAKHQNHRNYRNRYFQYHRNQ